MALNPVYTVFNPANISQPVIDLLLGADDYDGDGIQEVYFALTDGTAYLHAYMHADGNIRYANYQSQQQVIDFLTANGYDASTWAGWFPATQEADAKDDPVSEDPFAGDKALDGVGVPDGSAGSVDAGRGEASLAAMFSDMQWAADIELMRDIQHISFEEVFA